MRASMSMRRAGLVSLALLIAAAGLGGVSPWLPQPVQAKAKFKSKTQDKNTLDPAVNNYLEGMNRIKAGNLPGAIDSFLISINFARNNYDPLAYTGLGWCYKQLGQDAKAIDAFNKGIEQAVGGAPEARVDLGEIYMKLDRDQDAERQFNRALVEYAGPGPRARNALGKLYQKRGNLNDAQWNFEEALGDQPWMYTEAWMNLAENYMKRKLWGDAVKHYNLMLMRGKTLPLVDYQTLYFNLGTCYAFKGDHQLALDNWQKCLEINPDHAKAHLALATMFDSEKHLSSAVNEYKAFVRLEPSSPDIQKVKDRLATLEHMIKPVEPEAEVAKPSPYMRKAVEEKVAAERAAQEKYRQEMEKLSTPVPKDSGF